ncbi:MAG: hypothetical protein J7K87_04315 [Candidatus Aenigmarchaeota archaeon]|nr:hypothetical protein [Candidatus Aenigmarchaeota archaeon]
MVGYPVEVKENEVKAAGMNLPISTKNSVIVCRKLNNMKLDKAKKFLQDMIDGKRDINKKHYTKTAQNILELLELAEKNAKYKGLKNLKIKTISAERGPTRYRLKRRRSFGSRMKITHVKVVLKEVKK